MQWSKEGVGETPSFPGKFNLVNSHGNLPIATH